MRWLPKTLRAKPTLRGLVVRTDADDDQPAGRELYPWDRLSVRPEAPAACKWTVSADDSSTLTARGHPIVLKVSGRRARRVAQRAYVRHLRPAWRRGEFTFVVKYHRSRLDRWLSRIMPVACLLILAAMPVAGVMKLWQYPIEAQYRNLARALSLVMAVGCAVVLMYLVRLLLLLRGGSEAVEACFSCSGIRARLHDGHEVCVVWDRLSKIEESLGATRVEAERMKPLVLATPGLPAGPVWTLIAEQLPHQVVDRWQRRHRGGMIRSVLYCLSGGVLAWFLVERFVPAAPDFAGPIAAGGFGFFALIIAGLGLLDARSRSRKRRCKWPAK